MPASRVVVVILTMNQRELTRACLESLRDCREELAGVVMLDNASTDGTYELVTAEFPEVNAIRSETNLGMAAGRNLGLRTALEMGADYVWSIDNDTVVPKGTIPKLNEFMDANPDVGIAAATVCWGHERDKVWSTTGFIDWELGEPKHPERNRPYAELEQEVNEAAFICGCNMFFRAEVVRKTGGYDERFFCYYEDVDCSIRARKLGYRLVSLRTPVIYHYHRSALGRASPRMTYFVMRNRFLFVEQNCTPEQRRKFMTRWYLQYLFRFLPKRLLEGDFAAIRATRLALRDYWRRDWKTQPELG